MSAHLHRAPRDRASFAALLSFAAARNASLLNYVYPRTGNVSTDVAVNWAPHTSGCSVATDCYCFHVEGDMSKSLNPDGWKKCAGKSTLNSGCDKRDRAKNCCCLHGDSCLFSDMRPTKILAAITAARVAGITRIVEEGRFGGLSAFMYALHGFDVVSVEFLPLTGATAAIKRMAPQIEMVDGDGSKLLTDGTLLRPQDAARTMVIFDGEKRFDAYKTFLKVRHLLAVAIFDDTSIDGESWAEGEEFKRHLSEQGEIWVETTDPAFAPFIRRESAALQQLAQLKGQCAAGRGRHRFHGGIETVEKFHFTMVRGGAWQGDHTYEPRRVAH